LGSHQAQRNHEKMPDFCYTAVTSSFGLNPTSVGREYHDRSAAALHLMGTAQGFLPGFTQTPQPIIP
jgi:hypothetical protein